jgi:hypothetical protein
MSHPSRRADCQTSVVGCQGAGSQLQLALVDALCSSACEGGDPGTHKAAAEQLGDRGLMAIPLRLPAAVVVFTRLQQLLQAATFSPGANLCL